MIKFVLQNKFLFKKTIKIILMNDIIQELMNDKNKKGISLTTNNIIPISKNIIDIDPVPMFIKKISDYEEINEFLCNITSNETKDSNLFIKNNQDPNKKNILFTSQNAYVPLNNVLDIDHSLIEKLKSNIFIGIKEILNLYYSTNQKFKLDITNSWIQKFKNGTFLSPHNHLTSNMVSGKHYYSLAYYIDDGDPDTKQTFSGCVSFMINNKLFHVRPKPGLLVIWESKLIHLVNPFFSKSDKDRFMLSCNISVEVAQ